MIEYHRLLDCYDCMIRTEPWHDGRRDRLVAQMDRLWRR